jgi:hypothetical protein
VTVVDPGLQTLQRELASAVAGLSPEQLAWHPPQKWCIAEVLEYLYLTYTGTMKGFERFMSAGKPCASNWSNRGRALLVLGFGYLPSGREAPQFARPRGLPPEKVLAEIGPKIAEMDAMIARCQQQFGKNEKLLDHVFLGPLTAAQWRKFHLVHGRHHLKQIRSLRKSSRT